MTSKLTFTVIFVVVAWYFHDPVPRKFSAPWRLRRQEAFQKLTDTILWIPDLLGVYPLEQSIRALGTEGELALPGHLVASSNDFDGVKVKIYRPKTDSINTKGLPVLVYYHGGGWFFHNPTYFERLIIEILKEIEIIIVYVDYRLAPEFPFPVPFDDCVKATKYFLSNAQSFGADPRRVAIGGDSAGGNLAAAVSLKLRDDDFSPMPVQQILIYPALQAMDLSLPSYMQNRHGPLLKSEMMAWMWSMYATGSKKYASAILNNEHTSAVVKQRIYNTYIRHEDLLMDYHYQPYKKPKLNDGSAFIWKDLQDVLENPYFAPLIAPNVSNTPEAYVYTAQYDVLRDDGLLYVKRLREAGVPVTHVHGTRSFHGMCSFSQQYVEGQECVQGFVNYLKKL